MRFTGFLHKGIKAMAWGLCPLWACGAWAGPIPLQQAVPGLHAVTEELAVTEALKKALPQTLRRPDILRALRLRQEVPLAPHTPIQGGLNAPLTLVEFNDLNCLQCRDGLKQANHIFNTHKSVVRLAHRYAPLDKKSSTNLAAFYGKLAQQQNAFWAFRDGILNLTEFTPATLGHTLTSVGVNPRALRDNFFTNARLYYSQLDDDATLAEALKITPPQLFLQGMKIGEDIQPDDVDAMIEFLTNPRTAAILKNYDKVMRDDPR